MSYFMHMVKEWLVMTIKWKRYEAEDILFFGGNSWTRNKRLNTDSRWREKAAGEHWQELTWFSDLIDSKLFCKNLSRWIDGMTAPLFPFCWFYLFFSFLLTLFELKLWICLKQRLVKWCWYNLHSEDILEGNVGKLQILSCTDEIIMPRHPSE